MTPRIRELIAEIYIANRQVRPIEAHKLLLLKMKQEGLHELFGPNFPGLSSVAKQLKLLRERDQSRPLTSQGLDDPWSIGSLSKYPIPRDALPVVMSIFQKVLEGSIEELTVREAQWIARLSPIISDPDLLYAWAWQYAMDEWVSELIQEPFDTKELDQKLIRNPEDAQENLKAFQRWGQVWDIAEKYTTNLDETVDLMCLHLIPLDWDKLSLEEIETIAKSLTTKEGKDDKRKKQRKNEGRYQKAK